MRPSRGVREAVSDQSQTPARKGGEVTDHASPMRPRPEGSDRPRSPSGSSSRRATSSSGEPTKNGSRIWSPEPTSRTGLAWSVTPLRARPHWAGVVGHFPAPTGWGSGSGRRRPLARTPKARLEGRGVDLLEISGGSYESPAMVGLKASTLAREACRPTWSRCTGWPTEASPTRGSPAHGPSPTRCGCRAA